MTSNSVAKPNRKARRETLRLLSLCALLCVPLLFIAPVRDAGYRAACHIVPSLQQKVNWQMYAGASGGDLTSVKQALARGANIEGFTRHAPSPLSNAILNNHPGVALYLVQQGANVNEQTILNGVNTPFFDAVFHGTSPELVEAMIQHGANINWQDENGFSPLMVAVSQGDLPMVKLLIRSGANLNLRNKNNLTILEQAHYSQQTSIEKYLISLK